MKSNPLVSIVTVCYNAENTIEKTIKSVVGQSYRNIEYIIIDGGSTDGTVDIIKRYEHFISYYVSEPDNGIYNAMNKALNVANGEWICYMNSDDTFFDSGVVGRFVEVLKNINSHISIIYGPLNLIDQDDKLLYKIAYDRNIAIKKICSKLLIPHQSQFTRISTLRGLGGFNESYKIAADYELVLRILKIADIHFMSLQCVACMRIGGLSTNPRNSLRLIREYRLAQLNNSYPLTIGYIFSYLKVIFKQCILYLFGERVSSAISFEKIKSNLLR